LRSWVSNVLAKGQAVEIPIKSGEKKPRCAICRSFFAHRRDVAQAILIAVRLLSAALAALAMSMDAAGQNYTISTFAGGALPVNIPGTSACLYGPRRSAAAGHHQRHPDAPGPLLTV
jgi:hypothetical protein